MPEITEVVKDIVKSPLVEEKKSRVSLTQLHGKKKKVFESNEQQDIYEDYVRYLGNRNHGLVLNKQVFTEEALIPYVNPELKKRANTIASAVKIGFKLYLALYVLKTTSFIEYYPYLNEPNKYAEELLALGEQGSKIMYTIQSLHVKLKQAKGQVYSISIVTEVAIMLAWLEAKEKSGFFPQDLEVLDMNSNKYFEMFNEVLPLITNLITSDLFLNAVKATTTHGIGELDINFNPYVEEELSNLSSGLTMIINGSPFILSVNLAKPDFEKIIQEVAAYKNLELISQGYTTIKDDVDIYYYNARYKEVEEGVI